MLVNQMSDIQYNSNNDGLLKALGPYKVFNADQSQSGIKKAENETKNSFILGNIKVYGKTHIGKQVIYESITY